MEKYTELEKELDLNEGLEDMKNIKKTLSSNLKYLRSTIKIDNKKFTQEALADALDLEYSAISNYESLSNKSLPKLSNIIKLSRFFDKDIDMLLFKDITSLEEEDVVDCHKLGMHCIEFGNKQYDKFLKDKYKAYLFNNNSAYSSEIHSFSFKINKNKFKNRYDISMDCDGDKKVYSGNLVLTSRHIYLYFRGIDHYERALVIFHNPENSNNKPYLGGLGTICSISSGKRKDPCIQKIFLSNKEIPSNEDFLKELNSVLSLSNDNRVIRVDMDEDYRAFSLLKKLNQSK